jgi:enoyl-CoA hydratase/carnithine racemase
MDSVPSSYASLPYKHIRLSHVPSSSSSPTKVILVMLYRPGRHNAFTETMTDELVDALGLLSTDDRVKAIVVTGHGHMFCAGADLDEGLGKGSRRQYATIAMEEVVFPFPFSVVRSPPLPPSTDQLLASALPCACQ